MELLNKLLFHIEKTPELFKKQNVGFILGLTSTQIKDLKKTAIAEGLIEEKQRQFYLTDFGFRYLQEHPFTPSRINLEYLKLEKMPPTATKAIRNLAKHLLSGDILKENSTEDYIYQEIICSEKCSELRGKLERLLENKNTKFVLTDIQIPNTTKSVFAVLLLNFLSQNIDKYAIYEKGQFVLTLDNLVFDRMICCPQNFELQRTIDDNNLLLEDISKILLPQNSNLPRRNILEITKGLYQFIKGLESYTLNTERLSKKTLRFKNVILNAKDPMNLFYRDIPKVLSNKLLDECNDEFVIAFKTAVEELKTAKEKLTQENKVFLLKAFNSSSREDLSQRFASVEEYIGEKELKILSTNITNNESDDVLWIDRIATFVNKSRVPKDWKDSDVADYKLKIKELALKFSIIESTTGNLTAKLDESLVVLLEEVLNLPNDMKNVFLRRVVNG